VIGSRAELEQRAIRGLEQLRELHRPWIDDVPISCEQCGAEVRRIPEVGDAWLDAGIVPFSTLGWQNPERIERGYSNGAATGLSGADLHEHAYWEQWFPANWISEMREQIRLWFYSIMFMSLTLEGGAPYERVLTYEKLRDETGREMHKSWGNAIESGEAMERMGADVMRFLYADHIPHQNLNFGYGPANEVKRRLLTFWNSVSFFVLYANIEGFRPTYADLERGPDVELRPLDRWLLARTQHLVTEATDAYERYWTPDITGAWERFVDDLSNWYIRRSRRRFYSFDEAAFRTLWVALVQATRVIAPVMPFLAEHLWRNLVAAAVEEATDSVFLAGWPEAADRLVDEPLVAEIADTRRVVELGRQARAASGLKLRQPLRRLVVAGAAGAERHREEIAEELRVKEVEFGDVEATELVVKPNLRVLGPKLGKELAGVRAALQAGEFEELEAGRFRVNGHELGPDEVLVERRGREGWAVAVEDGITVALETRVDDELELEGRALDLIHLLNSMRKDAGFELTDRVRVVLPSSYRELEPHFDWIAREVLATEIVVDDAAREPQIAKA
jgi:isoleucyl-tRNA synthetase